MQRLTFEKFFFFSFFISFLFISSSAQGVSIPSASKMASDLEKRYHLNLETIQSYGESFNVSETKSLVPEVLVSFSPADPKPGAEITAKSHPLYFENDKEDLYYTWYLKRAECEIGSSDNIDTCDLDNDGKITIEDFKIEASRIIVNSTIFKEKIDYTTGDDDNDGYGAPFGGHEQTIPEKCYIAEGGKFYEIINDMLYSVKKENSLCPEGTEPRCVFEAGGVCPVEISASATSNSSANNSGSSSFDENSSSSSSSSQTNSSSQTDVTGASFESRNHCAVSQSGPTCSVQEGEKEGRAVCTIGEPRCVPESYSENADTCSESSANINPCDSVGSALTSCDAIRIPPDGCKHVFTNQEGYEGEENIPGYTGDGGYRLLEEQFWGTNPHDPDTANTGVGDEANLVGLGIDSFTWNYQVGDQVGVAVEGTSLIPTKHDDDGKMIMWALLKNKCPANGKEFYIKKIKGYDVKIETTMMKVNDCLESNLVDPREGGQQENMEVTLSALPDDPVNDSSGNDYGENLSLYSSIENSAEDASGIDYEWRVYLSRDGSYNPRDYTRINGTASTAAWEDITEELLNSNLVSKIKGNDLARLDIKLNLTSDFLAQFGLTVDQVFPEETGHLRITLFTKEQFSKELAREGSSNIIVRINNSNTKIKPSLVSLSNDNTFIPSTAICNDENTLKRGICYVAKNEVFALSFDENNPNPNLSYAWELDGRPLLCDSSISSQNCSNEKQTRYNFFPITKDIGSRHVVNLTTLDTTTGERKSYSRVFAVVKPFVEIISTNTETAWPKYLGYYQDTDGTTYDDISRDILQGYTLSNASLKALYFPSFIETSPNTQKQWLIQAPLSEINENNELTFPLLEAPGSTYNVGIEAIYQQDGAIREAMKNIWNLSISDTKEYWLEKSVQIEVIEDGEVNEFVLDTPQAFFASLGKNAPSYLWFILQTFLSIFVSILILGFLYSFTHSRSDR